MSIYQTLSHHCFCTLEQVEMIYIIISINMLFRQPSVQLFIKLVHTVVNSQNFVLCEL